jgi:Tol biopolymer transport system component
VRVVPVSLLMISRYLITLTARLMAVVLLLCGLALVSSHVMPRSDVIAYSSLQNEDMDLHLMEVNRRLSVNLTRTPQHVEFFPAWSPDGQQIAFVGQYNGTYDLYIIDSGGKRMRRLTDHFAYDLSPAWSPDGQQIVFASDRDGDFEIYITYMICDGGREGCVGNPVRLTSNRVYDDTPIWSPDGSQLLFESELDGNREIYVMERNGSQIQQLTISVIGFNFAPTWSADGQRIAFVSDRDGDWEIYVMNADGSNVQQLTQNPASDSTPNWSPDGRRILFTSNRDTHLSGNSELYVMDADGSNLQRLTWDGEHNTFPRWQP